MGITPTNVKHTTADKVFTEKPPCTILRCTNAAKRCYRP